MKEALKKDLEVLLEELPSMSEVELFLTIETIGGIKWREGHDYYDKRLEMSASDFRENQEYYDAMLKGCINILPKFGVTPGSETDRRNGDYWKWYHHWKSWMEKMTEYEALVFAQKLKEKANVTHFLPRKKWNEGVPNETAKGAWIQAPFTLI